MLSVIYDLVGRKGFGEVDQNAQTAMGFLGVTQVHTHFFSIASNDAVLCFAWYIHFVKLACPVVSAKIIKVSLISSMQVVSKNLAPKKNDHILYLITNSHPLKLQKLKYKNKYI